MRYLLILLLIFGSMMSSYSQYRGGNGDGYVNAQSMMLLPNPHITPVASLCPGSTLQLSVTPTSTGITYYWTGPNGFYSFEQNPKITNITSANAGKYKCIITLENSSPNDGNSDSIIVDIHNPIVVDAGNDVLDHVTGNPITLSGATVSGGSGSFSYSWTSNPSYAFVDNTIINPTTSVSLTASANFKLKVTDNNTGCINRDSLDVTVTGELVNATAKASSTSICVGLSTQLDVDPSGGNGMYTYEWTAVPADASLIPAIANQKNPIVSPIVSTTYTVKVTAGAENISKNIIVIVNPQSVGGVVAVTGNSEICKGETSSLSLSSASGTIQWQYSNTGTGGWTNIIGASGVSYNTPALNSTMYYRVTTKNGNCSYAISSVDTVKVNPNPTATISGYENICEGNQSMVTVVLTGSGPWSFQYTDGVNTFPIVTSSNVYQFNVNPMDSTTYTITAMNDAKCTGSSIYSEANVYVYPTPIKYNITSLDTQYCAGQNGVTISLNGSESGVDYQLLRNGSTQGSLKPGTGSALDWSDVINGVYTIKAINSTTLCESMMFGSKTVIQNTLPVAATVTNNGICGDGNVVITALIPGEGNQVDFSENGGVSVNNSVNYPSSYQYTTSLITAGTSKTIHVRTVVDSTGCASAWTNSAIATAYLPTIGGDLSVANPSICLNNSTGNIILTNKNGNVVRWEKSQDLNTWINIVSLDTFILETPDVIGTWKYRAVVKNGECNEAYSDTATVFVKAVPTAVISSNTTICNGSSANITLDFTGVSPWDVIYSDGTQNDTLTDLVNNQEIYTVNPATTTTYSLVSVSDANCSVAATGNVVITVNYAPNFQFSADTIDVTSYPYTLDAGADWDSLRWNDGSTNQTLQVNTDGEYNVTVWDNGCSTFDKVYVRLVEGLVNNKLENISIYPNPTKNQITIKSDLHKGFYKYEILNNHGVLVNEGEISNAKYNIDLSSYAEGVYIIKIFTSKGISINKIVKQR